MAIEKILVPDIGNFDSVDVIEIIAKIGDAIKKDDPLITLETDKASMDIPAPHAGTVKEILLKVGDKIKQGSPILMLDVTASEKKSEVKGLSIIPLKLFTNARGFAKLEIALAKGKKDFDKRDTEKDRDWEREKQRTVRDNNRYS